MLFQSLRRIEVKVNLPEFRFTHFLCISIVSFINLRRPRVSRMCNFNFLYSGWVSIFLKPTIPGSINLEEKHMRNPVSNFQFRYSQERLKRKDIKGDDEKQMQSSSFY